MERKPNGKCQLRGSIYTLAAAVIVALGAVVKLHLSFSGRYMGKEAGFALFEPGNLLALLALLVAALVFLAATATLIWQLVRARGSRTPTEPKR